MSPRHEQILSLQEDVEWAAKRLAGPALRYAELDDLKQDAYLGIVQAFDRYDGSTQFNTFMGHRIRGAMLDSLRHKEHRSRRTGKAIAPMIPLSARAEESWAAPTVHPDEILYAEQLWALVDRLPARQAYILRQLMIEDRTQRDIARELGLCQSRVSQIVLGALDTLKWWMTGDA